jgi:hypothetical protein
MNYWKRAAGQPYPQLDVVSGPVLEPLDRAAAAARARGPA